MDNKEGRKRKSAKSDCRKSKTIMRHPLAGVQSGVSAIETDDGIKRVTLNAMLEEKDFKTGEEGMEEQSKVN